MDQLGLQTGRGLEKPVVISRVAGTTAQHTGSVMEAESSRIADAPVATGGFMGAKELLLLSPCWSPFEAVPFCENATRTWRPISRRLPDPLSASGAQPGPVAALYVSQWV